MTYSEEEAQARALIEKEMQRVEKLMRKRPRPKPDPEKLAAAAARGDLDPDPALVKAISEMFARKMQERDAAKRSAS